MDKKRLHRRLKSQEAFAAECKQELRRIIESKDNQEIGTNPNTTQILVYNERMHQVLSHDIVAIGIGDDRGTLVFTDTFGDAYTDKDLFYISTVYPFILESVLGQH